MFPGVQVLLQRIGEYHAQLREDNKPSPLSFCIMIMDSLSADSSLFPLTLLALTYLCPF